MAHSWLRVIARSYWHSLIIACFIWGGVGTFIISMELVSVDFRMLLQDSLLALTLALGGSVISMSRSLRLMAGRWRYAVWLVAAGLIAAGVYELTEAFQTNLYVFPGVLAILLALGLLLLPRFTEGHSLEEDGFWFWVVLLLYLLSSIWWLYALNQPLEVDSILQNSVPGIILVGHFLIITLIYTCRDIVMDFYDVEREKDNALSRLYQSQQHYRSLFDHNPSAAFSLDVSGRFTGLNKAGEDYLQLDKSSALGMHYEYVLASSEVSKVNMIFSKALQGKPMHYETTIVRRSGEKRVLSVSNIPMVEDGQVVGVFGIAQDITAVKQTYNELEQANDELQNFAAVASHDLQEPLRKIVRFGELLKQADLPETEKDYLERMISASRRMQQLIHEILELARLGKESLQLQAIDLAEVMQSVMREHEAQLSSMGAVVNVRLEQKVMADAKLIKRVFDNLLTNAIKYSRKDKKLHIELYAQQFAADNLTVCFSDNGIGIDTQHQHTVFRPFKRLHSRSEIPGTGMGLAIVKKIVDLHHGDVVLSSQVGEGTTVKFTLPRSLN
ncbi:ATP-binding protein [Idiomarina piscisalsi]|uniref:sensor histidine kinase n=1 Tax=Idiomarina piscisalsi TaxID=1096243 RepID=UPI0013810905|nr:ATP-binding protein [Idiomarina piscisalsi]MTJ00998.1 PAS domain S-box protein [Idiomarina piscisalsi]